MAIGRLSLQEKRDIIGVFKTETSFSSGDFSYSHWENGALGTYRNKRMLSSLFKYMGTKTRCCAPLI